MRHTFQRPDGTSLRVDADLWLGALDLATVRGWTPRGTEPGAPRSNDSFEPLAYFAPDARRVGDEDARELASCLERALADVPERPLPLGGQSFGDENTLDMVKRAARGEVPAAVEAQAAREILSGPPRAEALELVAFLRGGGFAIERR